MSATVLPLPQPAKGKKRHSKSMGAMGLISLMIAERDGETIDCPNLERFDRLGSDLPAQSVALLLGTLILEVLTSEQQERLRQSLRVLAYAPNPSPMFVQLHNLLR